MTDIEKSIIDSLKRQIIETKRQISQISTKSRNKDLELRRKSDQFKAKQVLITLKLKKQVNDLENILIEHKKQWELDYRNKQILQMVVDI